MSDLDAVDLALVVLRVSLGVVFITHGYNHVFVNAYAHDTRWALPT